MGKAILVGAGVLFCSAMMLGAGLLVGTIRGEEGAKARRFREEQRVIATALAEDPAWAKVYSDMYTADGSAYLRGEVETKDDKERLRSRMLKLFGETRVGELVRCVETP